MKGSGMVRRSITSYSVHKARLADHNRQPSAIRLQNNRIWPRLEIALATMSTKARNSSRELGDVTKGEQAESGRYG